MLNFNLGSIPPRSVVVADSERTGRNLGGKTDTQRRHPSSGWRLKVEKGKDGGLKAALAPPPPPPPGSSRRTTSPSARSASRTMS